MSNDFTIKILPASGNDLRFLLSVNKPAVEFKRTGARPSALTPDDLEIFRSGNAPEQTVNMIADQISQWLIDGSLGTLLTLAFQREGEFPVRLILDVDDELRPEFADLPLELAMFQTLPFIL